MTIPNTPAGIVTAAAGRWLEVADPQLPVATLVFAFANRLQGQPTWGLIVAPPSSGKTVFIEALNGIHEVYPLSSLTARTFASGLKQDDDPSLLIWLRKKRKSIVTLKDFGTVLSLSPNDRNEILGQLREIYDGAFSKAFGTGVRVEWKGKLGLIAGATPAVDRLQKWSAELGERFVQFRPIAPDPDRAAVRASLNKGREAELARDLSNSYVRAFVSSLKDWQRSPETPPEGHLVCGAVAQLVAKARTPVHRDRSSGAYEAATPEGPSRLSGVFEQVYKAAYVCYGRDSDAAAALVRRIAVDSIAPQRRRALLAILATSEWGTVVPGLGSLLRCDDNTARYHLDDLVALGLAEKARDGKAFIYTLAHEVRDLAARAFLDAIEPEEAAQKLFDPLNNWIYDRVGKGE